MKAVDLLSPLLLLGVIASLGISSVASAQTKAHLKISASSQVAESFKDWTAVTPWEKITSFTNTNANRPTVDLVLQLQALKTGGLDFDCQLMVVPNYGRALAEVAHGEADLTAETVWDKEIDESELLRTDVVIRNGEFEKGLYAIPGNLPVFKVSSAEELRSFAPGTVTAWFMDIKTMKAAQLKEPELAPRIESLAAMLEKKRADFVLLEFSANPDMSLEINGVRLVPVPNCKVAIKGSRSWVISPHSPHSKELQAALDKGLKSLREEGRIERAYKESGFFNQKVASWNRLF
jgi:hypothetical protein